MKKMISVLVVLICISTAAWSQKYNFQDLVGNWRTKDGAGLEVVDSFKIYIVYQDKKKMLVNYSADFNSNPTRFNFVVRDGSGLVNIKSSLYFLNDDLVQWQVTESDTRPVNYNNAAPRKDVFIMRKVEERTN